MNTAPLHRAPEERRASPRAGGAPRAAPALDTLQRRANESPGVRTTAGYGRLLAGASAARTPVQRVKRYNHQDRQYINDEDGQPAPPGYAPVDKDTYDWTKPPWTDKPPGILEVGTELYDAKRDGLTNVGADVWNEPMAARGGIYTEAMSTCTTIGFRGYADGQLYTAMYHNTGTDQQPGDILNKIIRPLMQQFDGDAFPPFDNLTGLKWFAIGGGPSSKVTCASITFAFRMFLAPGSERELKLFVDRDDALTKNAMVDRDGYISYSLEQQQQKEAIGYMRELDRKTTVEGAEEEDIPRLAREALKLIDFVPAGSLPEAVTHVSRAVERILSLVPEMEFYNQDVALSTAYAYAEKHGLGGAAREALAEGVLNQISARPEYEGIDEEEFEDDVQEMKM
jgi:hypothetical protein